MNITYAGAFWCELCQKDNRESGEMPERSCRRNDGACLFRQKPVTGKPGRLKGKAMMSESEDLPALRRILAA
jgi:hypothetical protein